MGKPCFQKHVIGELVNAVADGQMNTFCGIGDFNADGKPDFAVCGRNGEMAWFENGGTEAPWKKHHIAHVVRQECGGRAIDLTGNGFPDIINGSDWKNDEMSWWENPGDDREWKRHLIAKTGQGQQHDTMLAPIKNDGQNYLIFTNQIPETTIFCVPIPSDPYQSPWPGLEVIAKGKTLPNPHQQTGVQPDEGLAVGDVDNDGKLELVCGVSWYKWRNGGWECHQFTAENYITNKIAVADIDRDGKNEILLSEGDAWIYGKSEGGKLAWFKPQEECYDGIWTEHIVETGLLDAHSIAVADLCGNGYPDIFVGEIGACRGDSEDYAVRLPRLMVYENDGAGTFTTRYIIDEGTGIHEAVLTDMTGDGTLDIVGKPLHGPEKWSLHVWFNKSLDK